MREIKFRGYDKDRKEWRFGSLDRDLEQKRYYITDEYEGIGRDVVENTIGQYTGLKDKNGKEIYEGDILKFKMYDGKYENYKIVFRNAEFEAINEDDTNFISADIWNVYGEVIGNIWEDSDLLNDSKNTETN